ncbi:MAG TPA: universal stress protein [Gemmatimonadota bacterium]|jgi:nucleotide-binding universal stress UspA family protein
MSAKWKKVLVATDFSDPAGRALESARALAMEAGGTIVLLHVVPSPVATYPEAMMDIAGLSEAWMREARRAIGPLATRARRGGRKVRTETRFGTAWRQILDVAQELGVDAICMGRSGHSRIERLALGSTAERVVRYASVPVIVTGDQPLKRLRRVLVPVDLGEGSAAALRLASRLAPRSAQLDVLLVIPGAIAGRQPVPYYPSAPLLPGRQQSEEALREFLELHDTDPETGAVIEAEDTAAGILERARKTRADLVVIATQGRRGLDRWLLGSVAEKVLRHAEAPVLALPWSASAAESKLLDERPRPTTRRPRARAEKTRPAGRRQRGPWTGHAHTGRGGPAGRRGGTRPRKPKAGS